jgi:hypothetical protein
MLTVVLLLGNILGSAELHTTGTAAGLNYSMTRHGILYVDICESTADELEISSWHMGHASMGLTVKKRRLSIDGNDCGSINVGDHLDIGPENEVMLNGVRIR